MHYPDFIDTADDEWEPPARHFGTSGMKKKALQLMKEIPVLGIRGGPGFKKPEGPARPEEFFKGPTRLEAREIKARIVPIRSNSIENSKNAQNCNFYLKTNQLDSV